MAKIIEQKVRKKQDHTDKYIIRMQAGKAGLVEATSKMDINEFRVFATTLTMILPDDEDFVEYEIRIQDIIKIFDLNRNGKYYEAFKDAALRLMDRKFVIFEKKEDGHDYKTTIPLSIETSEPVRDDEKTRIRIKFHPKLKPYLLDLQREYLTVDIRNIIEIQSHYSVKLYFVLKHQQRLGNKSVKYTVERLRQILAIEPDEYPLYGNFKQKVLQKGIDDINKLTDLTVTKIDEQKKVRAVESIVFYLEPKLKQLNTSALPKAQRQVVKSSSGKVVITNTDGITNEANIYLLADENTEDAVFEGIYERVKRYSITKSTIKTWLKEFPKEQINLGIDYVVERLKAGEKINNVGGYINQMIRNSSLVEVAEEQSRREAQEMQIQKTEQESKQKQKDIEKQKEEFSALFYEAQNVFLKECIENIENSYSNIYQELNTSIQRQSPTLLETISYEHWQKIGGGEYSKESILKAINANSFTFNAFVMEWINANYPEKVANFKIPFMTKAKELGVRL